VPTIKNWESYFPEKKHGIHLFEEYETRTTKVSAEVTRVATGKDAVAAIVNVLKTMNAKMVVCVPEAITTATGLVNAIKEAGITIYTQPEEIAKYAKIADAGITEMEFAVAETGSCVENDDQVEKRLCSALPPVHFGLLKTEKVIATIPDAFAIFSKIFDRGYISFITGPSRTADIERVLTIGVHGPGRMIPVFIDNVGGAQ
jgi:L-lactate dehydrogenase complex protein LldG